MNFTLFSKISSTVTVHGMRTAAYSHTHAGVS